MQLARDSEQIIYLYAGIYDLAFKFFFIKMYIKYAFSLLQVENYLKFLGRRISQIFEREDDFLYYQPVLFIPTIDILIIKVVN